MTDKKINLLNFIKGCLLAIGLVAMLLLWPFGTITNIVSTSSVGENNQRTGPLLEGVSVLQEFVPQFDYMESIGILINKQDAQVTEGNLLLVFANADFTQCVEVTVPISEMEESGYYNVPIQQQVIPGQTYYYSITSEGTGEVAPLLIYRRLNTAGPSENKQLFYNGILIENGTLACEYSYGTPLRLSQIATYYSFIIILVMLFWSILDKLLGEKIKTKKISIDKTIRVVASIGWTAAMIACCYYLLIQRVFGGTIWDMGIYLVAIIVSSIIAYFIIWSSVIPKITNTTMRKAFGKIPTGIQIVAFAFYFIRYAYYFNSGVNYGHYISYSYMNIAFGVILLVLFSRKEIFSIPNLVYSIVYGGSSAWWIATHNYDYETRTLYLLVLAAGWVWGMVIIRTVINLIHKKVRSFSIPYAILLGGFFAFLILFRNTRQWPVFMVIMFILFYLQKIEESKMAWLFRNLCNGAILSFYYFVFQSILFRPYHNIRYSRYPGAFSSVAIWGIYLLFIFSAIFVMLMVEYRKNNALKHMSFYYVTIGICLSYIFMSVSRTALFGIGIMFIIIFPFLFLFWFGKNVKKVAASLGWILLSFVLLFPGVYTVTRCVPAVVNKPIILPYEEFYGSILVGEAKDSELYMTFDHFLELSFSKLWTTFEKTQSDLSVDSNESTNLEQIEVVETEVVETEVVQNSEVVVPLSDQVEDTGYNDATSGRLKIYKNYMERLNWTGHDAMIITVDDEIIAHAHNTFLQSAYDHGILTGIIFVLLGIVSFFRSVIYMKRKSEAHLFTILPAVVIITFGIAGMTEWIFHPSIPIAFVFLVVQAPLLSKLGRKQDEK